ncbi:MAG: T9SS type A sorting domain-containing protein [Chitinophagaceae bacterium]|nr:T9SS type A sorting domain-containing protein [Chitinophagaceae bacterium]
MRVAAASATTFQEFSYKVPTPLAVPAGNVVLVSYTFRTGGAWNKNSDTVTQRHNFRPGFAYPGTTTMSEAPKYTWYSGDHSMSSLMFSTDTNFYAPQLVIGATNTATSWFYQYLLNSITVSCTSCGLVKHLSINETSLIAKVKAFPNPANTELSVPFTVNEKSTVTVSLTNMIGQVVATQSVNANAGQEATATFNTSNLAAGVYLYTVEANGQRVSNRVSVAH